MKRVLIERNRYFDSVFLMRIGTELEALEGISHATVAMGTRANLDNLTGVGFVFDDLGDIGPQDLLIALDAGSDDVAEAARARLEELLAGTAAESGATETRPISLHEAVEIDANVNLALISVPGQYAAREARNALRAGLHVMLFSDNVAVDDEVALKDEAIERGLLMMGPDCGTAIVSSSPLGFANACRSGTVGIVGASGTGIQEISSLVHRLGGGISQAIGTGGRDLSAAVDARTTRFGIEALGADPATEVIVVVSKTPAPEVAERVVDTLAAAGKPGIVHFVGSGARAAVESVEFAETLADAALLACRAIGIELHVAGPTVVSVAAETPNELAGTAGRVRGLYCGGTLCQEAWSLMDRVGIDVRSNVASNPDKKVHPEAQVAGHTLWDLGDDAFTVGKPHPMIEPSLRDEKVAAAGSDPMIGILLADCVIGYGAHPDPAGSLADAARRAIETAKADERELIVLASVTGTDRDPQDATAQRASLESAGVIVAESNAAAVCLAIAALEGGAG